jgi:predicted nucleic acid-binding protein
VTRLVLDASVIIKWAIPDRDVEPDVDQAVAILAAIRSGSVCLVEPPHWLAEVAAVLVRLRPEIADKATAAIAAIDVDTVADFALYQQALKLSAQLRHHLFDTLYHAVALKEPQTVLITADEAYFRKARAVGAIARLSDFRAIPD